MKKIMAAAAGIVLAIIVPVVVFNIRAPVLIVADVSLMQLYGEARIRNDGFKTSLALFRKIHTVSIADEAGDDVVQFAVDEISSRPFCVLFPLRFARAARIYRENNPQIPVVLLEGRTGKDEPFSVSGGNPNDYFVYKTDIDDEFYRAGMAAAAIDMGKNGKVVVFLEENIQPQARNAFLRALNTLDNPPEAQFFNSFSRFPDIPDISCAILAGSGAEFLEGNFEVPVIFLTWINPSFVPSDVVLVINDSPWAQAFQAAAMVKARAADGQIKSKFHVLTGKNIDKRMLQKLKKLS